VTSSAGAWSHTIRNVGGTNANASRSGLTEVTCPALGESITEGTVISWHKRVGDRVEIDEPLLEIATDKADLEIPSPIAGILLEVRVQEDRTVEIGAVLAVIDTVPGSRPNVYGQSSEETLLRQASTPRSLEPADAYASRSVHPDGPIFVVHGHDHNMLYLAVRVLERLTGREVIVLHEQANSGRTILEKFERHAQTAAYAVVLLTGDDQGGPSGGPIQPRGRQNVIFELGFLYGRLGRDRVAVLRDEGVEEPSDIKGLVYITLDSGGGWKHELGKELEAAKLPVDYRRMP